MGKYLLVFSFVFFLLKITILASDSTPVCTPVKIGEAKIHFVNSDQNPSLQVSVKGQTTQSLGLPIIGPNYQCRVTKKFEPENFLFVEFGEGSAGTQWLHNQDSLFVYRLENDELHMVKQVVLVESNTNLEGENTYKKYSYKIDRIKDAIVVTTFDMNTNKKVETFEFR